MHVHVYSKKSTTKSRGTVCYNDTHTPVSRANGVRVQDSPPETPLERSRTESKHPAQRLPFAQCSDRQTLVCLTGAVCSS